MHLIDQIKTYCHKVFLSSTFQDQNVNCCFSKQNVGLAGGEEKRWCIVVYVVINGSWVNSFKLLNVRYFIDIYFIILKVLKAFDMILV